MRQVLDVLYIVEATKQEGGKSSIQIRTYTESQTIESNRAE